MNYLDRKVIQLLQIIMIITDDNTEGERKAIFSKLVEKLSA